MGSAWRGARGGPSSSTSSVMSRTRDENCRARSAHAASFFNRCPYSFIAEPQPAALATTVSTPAASNAAIVVRAAARASSSRPACNDSAPQQPWRGGTTTSQPSAASTRADAAFVSGKMSCCTHPVSSATFRLAGAAAGVRAGVALKRDASVTGGAAPIIARSRRGSTATRPRRVAALTSGRVSTRGNSTRRIRARYGKSLNAAPRNRRSAQGRVCRASICARVVSISVPYCTPDGHAVTHATHPRHRSTCATNWSSMTVRPSTRAFIR